MFKSTINPFRHLGRRFWVPFLLACAIAIPSEAGFERLVESEDSPGITQSIFNISGLYERLAIAPRHPTQRYTAIVEIDPDKDPQAISLNEICPQRRMLARALCGINESSPAAIVIDKYFLPRRCEENEDLRRAIHDVLQSTPLVVGRRLSDDYIESSSGHGYYLLPSLPLGQASDPSQPREGIVNIDPDTRKLALQWAAFASKEVAEEGNTLKETVPFEWNGTLALEAVLSYDDKLAHHPRLQSFVDRREHPYVSFIRKEDFDVPVPITEILSADSPPGTNKSFCPDEAKSKGMRSMSGRVVMIGEINDLDEHASVVGPMPGLLLQANFIEAALDNRDFRPMPILDYVLGFVVLALLELVLIVHHGHLLRALMLIAALFVCTVGLLYFTVRVFDWYINPLPVGATTILIKLLHSLFGHAEKAAEH